MMKRNNKKGHITAFYLETLLLILVFVGIILVLTQIFGIARVKSSGARAKTSAVCLAQNAAECFAAARTGEDLLALLNEKDNAREIGPDDLPPGTSSAGQGGIEAFYRADMTPDKDGELKLCLSWTLEGGLRRAKITVVKMMEKNPLDAGEEDPVFSLDTAVYDREGWQ